MFSVGYNGYGNLGIGNTTDQSTIQQIPFFKNNNIKIIDIETGYAHSLAISEDGEVYSWGYNGSGQLGNGNNNDQSTPIKIYKI